MKSIWFFLKTTVKGGILFFLPLIFILIVVEKVVEVFSKVISPIAIKLGIDNIAGKATISLLIVIVVLLICFIGGLLMQIKQLKKINQKLDEKLTKLIPTYREIKTKAAGTLDSLENKHLE